MAGEKDIIRELTDDHRDVDHMLDSLDAAPHGDPERKRLVNALTVELVRLAMAEEESLHPAVRKHLTDGKALVDKEVHDLGAIERTLKQLENRDADDPDFDRLVAELEDEVTRHEHEDEEGLFVELRRSVSTEELATMGADARRAMAHSDDHPHLHTPDTPPEYESLSMATIEFVDRIRALLHGHIRPQKA
ncbi:hemerythrin domain-containing protein [Yinghuangia seranimata]|uniref:hemerythrin domain-containing protein n=1 Tax=Yinghuangia seranimata TaxID=408067 RepID=UPI00248C3B17|nr:hemerythrin domain-containing protein [Yinghuangia seranimata]MDI2128760.1 hemerythrin domain-containing protein [Yinghuangia seranimata]